MRILSRLECSPAEWDAFCDASDDTWLFHRWDWAEIERQFFCQEEHSFAIVDSDNCIRAILPLYEIRLGLGSWCENLLASGLHRFAGPAFHPNLAERELMEARATMLHHLFNLAERINADRVQLGVQSLAPNWRHAMRYDIPFWIKDKRFESGPAYGPNGLVPCPGLSNYALEQIVDLQKSSDFLFDTLDASCRRAIRKAKSAGLQTTVEQGLGAVASFYQLAEISATRTGEQLVDKNYYEAIDDKFSSSERSRIFLVRHDGNLAAALFIISDKNTMSYLAGPSDSRFHNLRVNDWIHWSAILWGQAQGFLQYRLGVHIPRLDSESPVGKITRFKTKFSNLEYESLRASYYRNPKKYYSSGRKYLSALCRVSDDGNA